MSRLSPLPGRTLLSRQGNRPFPLRCSGLREGSPGSCESSGRGANPEEKKKCRQRKEQMQRHKGVSHLYTPRETAAVQMAEPREPGQNCEDVGPTPGSEAGQCAARSALRTGGVSLEAAAVTQAREKSDPNKDLGGDAFLKQCKEAKSIRCYTR